MRASNLREHNMGAVLAEVVRSGGAASRADVAQATRLTRSTVSAIVDDLLAAGVLRESAPVSSGTGRPKTPLSTTDTMVGLGAEIAADHVRVIAATLDGSVPAAAEADEDVPAQNPARIAGLVAELAGEVLAQLPEDSEPTGLTVSVPGRLSADARSVRSAPSLRWADVPFADLLAAHDRLVPLSPGLANDSDLTARHEADARPGESFLFVHGETGIGGAVVLDGRRLRGDHGWAGEIGHVNVVPGGALCGCGRRGCLEAYAGFHALRARAGLGPGAHIDDLAPALRALDHEEPGVLDELGAHLGAALAAALNVLDLETVVLSGYFRELCADITPGIRGALDARSLQSGTTLAPARRTRRREAEGAAQRALQPVLDDVAGWLAARPPRA